jgi:hypothetical protein
LPLLAYANSHWGEATPQHFVSDLFEPRLNWMTNIGCKQIQILSPVFSMKGFLSFTQPDKGSYRAEWALFERWAINRGDAGMVSGTTRPIRRRR